MFQLGTSFPKFCHQQIAYESSNTECIKTDVLVEDSNPQTSQDDASVCNGLTEESETTSGSPMQPLLLLKMLANRANGKWVEESQWTQPHVYDPATLIVGRADIRIYKQIVMDILQEGKVRLFCNPL